MARFAVYYVPKASSKLYKLGSSVIGFDVRKQKNHKIMPDLRSAAGFSEDWIAKARPYGFHLTIGDSIEFEVAKINAIEREIEDILGCFNPVHIFTIKQRKKDFVAFWKSAVVLRYNPNDHLKLLHAVIAARIHPMGTGSGYLRRHLQNPEKEKKEYRAKRTRKFFSPTIFDGFSPHFTLLNPYTGEGLKRKLSNSFTEKFSEFKEITLESICLLVQSDEGKNWNILREFTLK